MDLWIWMKASGYSQERSLRVALVLISFICKQYSGELVESNEESIQNSFFPLDELPENIFTEHRMLLVDDLLSKKPLPIIG